jgi:peptidyl-dipeptidase A
MRSSRGLLLAALALLALPSACVNEGSSPGPQAPCPACPPPALFPVAPPPAAPAPPTVEEARAFFAKVDADLRKLFTARETMGFVSLTHITDDTERLAAQAEEAAMEYLSRSIQEARRYEGLELPPELARQARLLRLAGTAPAPSDAKERGELAEILSSMQAMYGKGKHCSADGKKCRDLGELSRVLRESKKYDELQEAWAGWHSISRPMRDRFTRYVELGNKGAQEIGFKDMGALWRSGYDMTPEEFEADVERLWGQVKPLYDELHCYVRGKLQKRYGKEKIKDHAPIPAHLLGNMWAQEWTDLFPLVEPFPGQGSLDVTASLKRQKYDAVKMVKLAEQFFVSLGMDPLPKTFWERSMFTKPRDREVVCHASAWDVNYSDDLRIKMCIKIDEEDLITIHHELGHNYYYHHYYKLPILFQSGANDGFHEAVGDTLALSVTPAYLKEVKLVDRMNTGEKASLNFLMKQALDKIAFLPFGLLIDKWRWDVFAGKTSKANYNKAWWDLRRKYQGVEPPVPRSEEDFDPGAKYHVPGNTPYVRYFLARIYQFQFHRALCKAAGHQGPLMSCSIHNNKAAGEKLMAMLRLGASKPWSEALATLSGERQADASAMVEYFAPLSVWLKEQNKGQSCGWDGEADAPTTAAMITTAAAPAATTAPAVLTCPEGTEPRGDAPPRGRELFCVRNGSGGSVKHGPFRSWSVTGKPEVEGEYNDGKMAGKWILYHPNGNRESEGTFAENKKEGVWIFYTPEGKKIGEKTYRAGEETK